MAYMSQERKKEISAKLKEVLAGSGLKYSLSVRNHSTIVMTITAGRNDFVADYLHNGGRLQSENYPHIDVNPYYFRDYFSGENKELMIKIFETLNMGNHDNSDIQSDYFDVGWYVDVNVGTWSKPYTKLAA